ncbi:MAG: transposase family protein, partial [Bacteroidetes bacterium]|nr:transposase family protein [Bacteroidota bacterium]
IVSPNQGWSTDITYVPMPDGFMYLVAVIDWYSRYVLSWQLSNTLDGHFCLDALEEALEQNTPDVFNTDQGVQFTARRFTGRLEAAGISVTGHTGFFQNRRNSANLRGANFLPPAILGKKRHFSKKPLSPG